MADIKLFRLNSNKTIELKGTSASLEKSLQGRIQRDLDIYLGVTFLATELSTGARHGGRIDTLGIDENGCPVIIEYKRSINDNVINQGLFYLDWLMDHKAEFELLVIRKLGEKKAEAIDWSNPRLLCIAGDFKKYDEHAVQQINRNIELIRYKLFGDDLLLFELVNATSAEQKTVTVLPENRNRAAIQYKTVEENLRDAPAELSDLYHELRDFALNLGDDVQEKTLKYYFAFKRIKNFACIEIQIHKKKLLVYLKVNPNEITLEMGFTRDVTNIGHFGTGDLEVTISNHDDFVKAQPLILKSYENS